MFSIIDSLNSAFTLIATAYVYLMAIALLLLIVQEAIASCLPIVSDNFYQQTKDLFAESETEEYAVAIAVVPSAQKANYPSGKALVITVKEESEFSKMNLLPSCILPQSSENLVGVSDGQDLSRRILRFDIFFDYL